MLLRYFPKFFSEIPWQKTGTPVSISGNNSLFSRVVSRLVRELKSIFGLNSSESFTDYRNWIRNPVIANELEQLLDPSVALYANFLNQDFLSKYLKPHLRHKALDYSNKILRAASIEIYLRQLNERNFLNY